MRPRSIFFIAVSLALGLGAGLFAWSRRAPPARLVAVGPRVFSNQTGFPLTVLGEGLLPGMRLRLGPPFEKTLPLAVLDDRHAYARTPSDLVLAPSEVQREVACTIDGAVGSASLTVVNDLAFPDLTSLAASSAGRWVFAASSTTDQVFAVEIASGKVLAHPGGDGPSALSMWTDGSGREWLVVAHLFEPSVWLLSVEGPFALRRVLEAPAEVAGVRVDPRRPVAYLAEAAHDSVVALPLETGGKPLWTSKPFPNPRALALLGDVLAVGSLQTGEVALLDAVDGKERARFAPGPGVPIVGGGSAAFSAYVMGGKAVRDLVFSKASGRLFQTSIGPNIGPNPQRLEVSMNGGVAALDPIAGKVLWHLGFGAGVTEALALDDARGLLFASDPGLGLLRVLDAKSLGGSSASAQTALLQQLSFPPPEGFPLARPAADYQSGATAGVSMHSGPRALALSADGASLFVLNRFTASLAVVDVTLAAHGKARVVRQIPLTDPLSQPGRRIGQVLFYADMGRTAMSCDACHLEGHTEGVFFEKTQPMRIYRSSTLRGAVVSPPYFTPMSTQSIAQTAQVVGGRNRFHHPDPTGAEVEALAAYTAAISWLPNPFVGADGAPVATLELPDGKQGNPRRGLVLFEGKAGCAACHPAPHFTTDQDSSTRGRFFDVGTPHLLPLREGLQDAAFRGFAPPSLSGAWDVFPMLTTGGAGLSVGPEGALVTATAFPLKEAIERFAPQHGRADLLSSGERDDLLAYVLSL